MCRLCPRLMTWSFSVSVVRRVRSSQFELTLGCCARGFRHSVARRERPDSDVGEPPVDPFTSWSSVVRSIETLQTRAPTVSSATTAMSHPIAPPDSCEVTCPIKRRMTKEDEFQCSHVRRDRFGKCDECLFELFQW